MKFEKNKRSLLIKGTVDVYHSVTYLYGYQRFWAFTLADSFYELEENQDQEGKLLEPSLMPCLSVAVR